MRLFTHSFYIFLALFLGLILSGCSDQTEDEEDPPRFAAGTYAGRASGFGGPLKVSTSFSADSITAIVVGDHSETTGKPAVQEALAAIPQAILAAQRLDVDAVSGATATSLAIIEAVEDCVLKAGGNPAELRGLP
jgi:fumarate reductase flavoprotein subunit